MRNFSTLYLTTPKGGRVVEKESPWLGMEKGPVAKGVGMAGGGKGGNEMGTGRVSR